MDKKITCSRCGEIFNMARYNLNFRTCLDCGEQEAKQVKRTVAHLHKSSYMLITDLEDLKDLNPKYIRSK